MRRVKVTTDGKLGGWDTWPPPTRGKFNADVLPGAEGTVVADETQMPDGWLAVHFEEKDVWAVVHPSMVEEIN